MEHRTKRLYQPSLENFVIYKEENDSASRLSNGGLQPHNRTTYTSADIQSSLLNVGMRVRKAVPSGYQTTKIAKSAEKAHTPLVQANTNVQTDYRPRELAPLCGIHKVGGYGNQVNSAFGYHGDENEFRSSSLIETMPVPDFPRHGEVKPTGKRRYEDSDNQLLAENVSHGLITPKSNGPLQFTCAQLPLWSQARPKAKPFSRRRGSDKKFTIPRKDIDSVMTDVADFEDAPFLLPPGD